jgi:hypothetical protein
MTVHDELDDLRPLDDAVAGAPSGDDDANPVDRDDADRDTEVSAGRVAFALAFPLMGAAVMTGGVFTGVTPRIYAAIAGLLGLGLGLLVVRVRSALVSNVLTVVGLFAIGLVLIGPGNIANAGDLASTAAREADLSRPPAEFVAGWKAILGWLMGIVGFATVWVGVGVRRRSLALLVPLPFAGIAGISVPDSQQVASGLCVLVLFALGLGVLSSINSFEGAERPPLAYELRKLVKSMPIIAVITAVLVVLSQTSFLFPDPQIDPAEEPQKPKTVPLSEVEDRVLFEVGPDVGRGDTELIISGPWRMGTLSTYDGTDWRLPPVAANEFEDVPESGIIEKELAQRLGVRARFRILGLGGTVLPGLPLSAAIQSDGVPLAYDATTGNVRTASGQVRSGQTYVIAAATLPAVADLRLVGQRLDLTPELRALTEIPAAPPAMQALLDEAAAAHDNLWDRFDFLRTYILDNVVATGAGAPVSITPARVQEILGDTLEASPFELVAMQAMAARWLGIPSRIGYGFDGGERAGAVLEVRPKHGASFVEVNFPTFGWLPVIGKPKQAKPTVGADPGFQQVDPNILPSNDTAVQVYLPAVVEPIRSFVRTIQVAVAVAALIGLAILATYLLTPVIRKARLRSRRREAARRAGPRARVALAYAEWRDHAADFGFPHPVDTPLMFLDRIVEDPEHTELAWLTTRALWGDQQVTCDDRTAAAAEELSRSLRRRLTASQPGSMRLVAAVSRVSLREPYAPATDLTRARRNGHTPDAPSRFGTFARRRRNGAVVPDAAAPHEEKELDRVPTPV